jgi:DNA-binding TFAR19-related protein (PDSD5 family)
MVNSPDEAKELLNKTYEVFKNQYDKVKNEKHQSDYSHSKDILYKLAKEKVEDTDEMIKLKKKRSDFYEKASKVDAQINKLNEKIQDEKLLEVCNEIKKNDYKIPEEEIERFLCTTTYFEKSAIIQAVTEVIARIDENDE